MTKPYAPTVRWTYPDFKAWNDWIEETFDVRIEYHLRIPNQFEGENRPWVEASVYVAAGQPEAGQLLFFERSYPPEVLTIALWSAFVPLHGKIMQVLNELLTDTWSPQ